jgi:hypothetical protein
LCSLKLSVPHQQQLNSAQVCGHRVAVFVTAMLRVWFLPTLSSVRQVDAR